MPIRFRCEVGLKYLIAVVGIDAGPIVRRIYFDAVVQLSHLHSYGSLLLWCCLQPIDAVGDEIEEDFLDFGCVGSYLGA